MVARVGYEGTTLRKSGMRSISVRANRVRLNLFPPAGIPGMPDRLVAPFRGSRG